ncbi:iron ABC transporter permease [Mergibacter septicus]|uniref:Iron ABC transporter permease n=2 Tax=Mergibacter septicus TaxID=221402 RepID=A0A8E3S8D2_9PAST|nr:iron ABC transporter permease [Mergibacter septicus]QDJ14357.1 iron ABC transporter permease [Mergibacter septicus]UTU48202.1 iron ABC transporter permease [Mergibacter septicus]
MKTFFSKIFSSIRFDKIKINLLIILISAFFLMPILAIFRQSIGDSSTSIRHLWQTVLTTYLENSLLLVLGTVLISLILALPCAVLVSRYQFRSRAVLQWLLCLPLAIPAYLLAYFYTDFLDYSGVLQRSLRAWFGWKTAQDYWFPSIRTLEGACIILGLSLYPYIFLLSRLALLEQAENLSQSAALLGAKRWQIFYRVTLPLIRPAIAVGCALVAMETLGDFGTVFYFAVPTLTTAIYDTWLGFSDLHAASQISLAMLGLITLFILLERYARRRQRHYQRGSEKTHSLKPLKGIARLLPIYAWTIVIFAFFLPISRLLYWSWLYFDQAWSENFGQYALNSLLVSSLAMVVCVVLALLLHFYRRLQQKQIANYGLRFATLGYAIPGTVLAIGLLIPLTGADHLLHSLTKFLGLPSFGLIFSGSIVALVVAYVIRFSTMAVGSLDTALAKIPPSLDMAGRTLGHSPFAVWRKIHFPLLRKGILTALLMVFIESMKELNASLLLRPFNFDTLATHVFTYTSDEQLEKAALPAVVLVLVGLLPVIYITRSLLSESTTKPFIKIEDKCQQE